MKENKSLEEVLEELSSFEIPDDAKKSEERLISEHLPSLVNALGYNPENLFLGYRIKDRDFSEGRILDAVLSEDRSEPPKIIFEAKVRNLKPSKSRAALRQVEKYRKNLGVPFAVLIDNRGLGISGEKLDEHRFYKYENISNSEIKEIEQTLSRGEVWQVEVEDQLSFKEEVKSEEIERYEHLNNKLEGVEEAETNEEKRISLERFAELAFSDSEDFDVKDMNLHVADGEMDLILEIDPQNRYRAEGIGRYAFVECKNWSDSVGSGEVRKFQDKMINFDVQLGIIFAKEGVTGSDRSRDSLRTITRAKDNMGLYTIVITYEDMKQLADEEVDVDEVIDQRIYDLRFDR